MYLMKHVILPVVFALIAAVGNAFFALAQKKGGASENGLLFVGLSALISFGFAVLFSPLAGGVHIGQLVKSNGKYILLSGGGLFLTYLGFNLLYSKFGVSQYVLYAVISIITTTLIVGVWWLKEPMNIFHKVAICLSVLAVLFFSYGQSRL